MRTKLDGMQRVCSQNSQTLGFTRYRLAGHVRRKTLALHAGGRYVGGRSLSNGPRSDRLRRVHHGPAFAKAPW